MQNSMSCGRSRYRDGWASRCWRAPSHTCTNAPGGRRACATLNEPAASTQHASPQSDVPWPAVAGASAAVADPARCRGGDRPGRRDRVGVQASNSPAPLPLCVEQQPSADNHRRDVHDAAAGHLTCRRGHRSAQPAQCVDDRLRGYQTFRPMVNNSGCAAGFRRPGRSRLMLVIGGAWALAII